MLRRLLLISLICTASGPLDPAIAAPTPTDGTVTCPSLPAHAMDAARARNVDAMAIVGDVLISGSCGDDATTIADGIGWLQQAAALGHSGAHLRLGLHYHQAGSTREDTSRAIFHFRIAALDGWMVVYQRLGLLLLSEGTSASDQEEGLFWLGSAASQGDATAAVAIGLIYARGLHGVPNDACLALDWYEAGMLMNAPMSLAQFRDEIHPDVAREC